MPEDRPTVCFRARIYRVGILRCVDVPHELGANFGGWQHPPVRLQIGDAEGTTHLAPAGGGAFRLFLDGNVRRRSGVDTGDDVEIRLQLDPSLQTEPFPDEVVELADRIPGGDTILATLPPGLRRQLLRFLAEARSGPAREKRLRRIGELLQERAEKQGFGAES